MLQVSRHAPRKWVGQALGLRKRQYTETVSPAKSSPKCRGNTAQDITMRIGPGKHHPRCLAMQFQWLERQPAMGQQTAPQQACCPKFGKRGKGILHCAQCDADSTCQLCVAKKFHRPEMSQRRGQRRAQFFSVGKPLAMTGATIGSCKGPNKTRIRQAFGQRGT